MIALLPCAGKGMRMPQHRGGQIKQVIKELYPVNGRPLIDYAIDVAVAMRCQEAVIVIAQGKEAIAEHVAERQVFAKLWTVYQQSPLGTGHAVSLLEGFTQRESFLYLMPDTVFTGIERVLPRWESGTVAGVWLWPTNEPKSFGCFHHEGGRVDAHVEKKHPSWEEPYLMWGAAMLRHDFPEVAKAAWVDGSWKPFAVANRGDAKEMSIDDVFDVALKQSYKIGAAEADGYYFDCGTLEGLTTAERRLRGED